MSLNPHKFQLLYHTLKYMRPIQLKGRIGNILRWRLYRLFPKMTKRRFHSALPSQIQLQKWPNPIPWFKKTFDGKRGMCCVEELLRNQFTFLNQSKKFPTKVFWENKELSYLWDFNLHYFEYINAMRQYLEEDRADRKAVEEKITEFISSWIDNNPITKQPAWHPYPISLRIINWIRLFINHPELVREVFLRNLYIQLLFLEENLEKHLMVNHYLENGRALMFGALFFQGKDAERWYSLGLKILKQEIVEEYLPNGGHFERSPMYHCILLENMLDTWTQLNYAGKDAEWLRGPLIKMCEWLDNIQTPDGQFPLFNDAAFGISASPDEILQNATRMLGFQRKQKKTLIRDCDNYFILDSVPFFCAVDGAYIGPSYNPGHGHSDNLTYELFYEGKRFVVDSGTYSYENDSSRHFFRSTANHNTLVINGLEQSQVWGGFRVAKRSSPFLSKAGQLGEYLLFQGSYKNQVSTSQNVIHERIIAINPSAWILIYDTVKAQNEIIAESHCHFAPDWQISEQNNQFHIVDSLNSKLYCLPLNISRTTITKGQYAPEFGKNIPINKLTFTAEGQELLETGYIFAFEEKTLDSDFSIKRSGKNLTIRIDNNITELSLWC